MDVLLQEEHHQVRATVRKFADEVVAPGARELDENEEFPTAIVKQMGELGFMGLPYPEQYGGAGLDMLAYAIAVEEIAPACGSTAITTAAHRSATVAISSEDCLVPEENVIGDPTTGFKTFMRTLTGGRISIGALALGLAQGAYEHSLRFAKQRHQFGQPIASFQAIQFMLADMATRIEASRLLVYRAAVLKDQGREHVKEAAMAKLFASEAGNSVTDKAIQINGGVRR